MRVRRDNNNHDGTNASGPVPSVSLFKCVSRARRFADVSDRRNDGRDRHPNPARASRVPSTRPDPIRPDPRLVPEVHVKRAFKPDRHAKRAVFNL